MRRPITILISAMGGEGGGVLAAWLTNAAVSCGLPVQRTSIPGVAQRTGATAYYVEIYPRPWTELYGQQPVLALSPTEGELDLVVATELLEAARAVRNGYVTTDRTVLLASTHRVYAIGERSSLGGERLDSGAARASVRKAARVAVLFDCLETALRAGSHINAVILGAIAESGTLPIPRDSFRSAIREEGKSVERNLKGFEAGLQAARAALSGSGIGSKPLGPAADRAEAGLQAFVVSSRVPAELKPLVSEACRRLTHYQNRGYAGLYLKRLERLLEFDQPPYALVELVARQLALWMAQEDVIRVAQLKSAPGRTERIAAELRVDAELPIAVTEYLKPGPEELASLLPPALGRRFMNAIRRRGLETRLAVPIRVRSTTITGFLMLRMLALLRCWRPYSYGYHREQTAIEEWLIRVESGARLERDLAVQIAECASLVRGYGDTRARGFSNYRAILTKVVDPVLEGKDIADGARRVRQAREAAIRDDTGAALGELLARPN